MPSPFSRATLPPFADDFTGCDRLLAALLDSWPSNLSCQRITCPALGPQGDGLASTICWLGSPDAENVLVLLSGTHGVEGMAGSAIQRDFLQHTKTRHWQPPAGCAVLVIHALNPWGMAWVRRCDQDGVDLNRNFIDFNQPLPDNAGYRTLRDSLLSTDDDARQRALAAYRNQYGQTALEIAISGGQYDDPCGPFFGGQKASPARQLIEQLIADYRLAERRLAVIDLHTGLGPYGYGEIICDHAPDSAGVETARRWYGDGVTLPLAGSGSSVPKTGLLDYAWHQIMGPDSCFVTLEFGSFSTDDLFGTLLADHRLHQSGLPDWNSPDCQAVKRRMREHFFPAAPAWREALIWRGRQVITMALTGLVS